MFTLAPETKRLLDLFLDAQYGTVFSYGQILKETGLDVMEKDRGRIYSVNRILERDHMRSVLNVRGVGYKVALPQEHRVSMAIRKGRAGSQIERAIKTGGAANIALLDPVETQTLADMTVHMTRVHQALAHHDARIARLEEWKNKVAPEEPPIDGTLEESG